MLALVQDEIAQEEMRNARQTVILSGGCFDHVFTFLVLSLSSSDSTIPRIRPGDGHITVEFDSHRGHTFTQLSYIYPLKLLSSRNQGHPAAIVHVLLYRGGLVGRDEFELEVTVGEVNVIISGLIVIIPTFGLARTLVLIHFVHSRGVPQKRSRTNSRPALTFKDGKHHLNRPKTITYIFG